MISWLTTVAPSTTASSSFSRSNSASGEGFGGFFSTSSSSSESASVSASWDFSRTSVALGTSTFFTAGTTFIQEPPVFDQSGFDLSGSTQTTLSLTKTRSLQTSTTQSTVYQNANTTGSETFEDTQWTTATFVVSEKTVTEIVQTVAESSRMIVVTRPTLSSEATVTTALTVTEFDPDFYATIYETNNKNEVLWFLDTFAENPFSGGYSAASKLATTVTRTTVMPWTKTKQAPVVNSSQPLTSFAGTEITTAFSLATESALPATITITAGDVALPAQTDTLPFASFQQTQTTTNTTFINLPNIGSCASTEQITVWFMSLQKATAYPEFTPAEPQNTFETLFPIATSTTHRTFVTHLTTGSTASGASASGNSRASQIYLSVPQGLTTFMQSAPLERVFAQRGVIDTDGGVVLYYNSPVTIDLVYEEGIETFAPLLQETIIRLYAEQSREVSTLFPGTFSFVNFYEDVSGFLSVSGLSVSATSINITDSTASKTTTSFVVQPEGQSNIADVFRFANTQGGTLGQYESAFLTQHPGVYRYYNSNGSTATASTTGAIVSWTGTRETSSLRPLSCLVPSFAPMEALVWTATRNNHFFRSNNSTAYAP